MWVKICGNTNLEDAALAAALGADAVGFIFAPSKRRVTAEQVADITPHLPAHVERIGVFTDTSAEEIAHTVETAHLDVVQLHGAFQHGRIERLTTRVPQISIIPVMHWDIADTNAAIRAVMEELNQIAKFPALRRVLIDAKVGAASGGTGVSFDWNAARHSFRSLIEQGMRPILAGGLRPQNVAEAIRLVQPWGVDVSSGVENAPGRKDPAALAAFIAEARRVPRPLFSGADSK